MRTETSHCPKCGGSMEEGFLLDEGRNSSSPASWIEGPPERSFWTGVKTRGREKLRVVTYRCERCGFLEAYATEPVN